MTTSARMGSPRSATKFPNVSYERRTWQRAQEVRGREVIPLDVKAGDKILFGKYSAVEIKLNGEEHLILREDDILGVIEE